MWLTQDHSRTFPSFIQNWETALSCFGSLSMHCSTSMDVNSFKHPECHHHKVHFKCWSRGKSIKLYLETALWYIFSRTNPLVDISDKPIRDIGGLYRSQTNEYPSMLFKAIDSSHHHPSSFSTLWHCSLSVSCPLIPDIGSLQAPGCNHVHPPGISDKRVVWYCSKMYQNH